MQRLRSYFLAGLITLLPLAISLFIFALLLNFLTDPFVEMMQPLMHRLEPFLPNRLLFLLKPSYVLYSSKVIILILLFIFTIFLGMLARWFITRSLFQLADRIVRKIPLVSAVYKTTHDIISTLFSPHKQTFQKVVLAPFPHKDSYALALVVQPSPESCQKYSEENLTTILIPTTPNPTSGFLLLYPDKELIYIDMSAEEAIKYIVSCGVVAPSSSIKKEDL